MATGTSPEGLNQPTESGETTHGSPSASKGGPLSGPLGIVISVVLLSVAGYLGYRTFINPPPEPPDSAPVWYVCSETGKAFEHIRQMGEMEPVYSPLSKKNTGYRAEKCFWTKDGKVKTTPTYVLLNELVGKLGPTLCPDCGRLVEPHNKRPSKTQSGAIVIPNADSGEDKATSPPPTTQPSD